MDFVKRTLSLEPTELSQILEKETLTNLLEEHMTGGRNRRLLVWSLINLEFWLKSWL